MNEPSAPPQKIVRVLSIDGGGIRGAAVAQFLANLEEHLGRPIYECFDMFTGTSVGGIMAAAMVYGKLPARTICDELMTHKVGSQMMPVTLADRLLSLAQTQPKFDGVGKRAIIDTYCGNGRRFCPAPWEEQEHGALPFVMLTTYDMVLGEPRIHRNWDDDNDELLADVVDQTSAAPGFFPIVSSDSPITGRHRGIDGAVFANNPTDCAYAEALKIYGPDADIRVLSIGTGEPTAAPEASRHDHVGGIQWLTENNLLSIVYDGPQKVVDMRMRTFTHALGHHYVRVNGPLVNMQMDDVSEWNIRALKAAGNQWWRHQREQVVHSMGFNGLLFRDHSEPPAITSADIGSDYKPYFTLVNHKKQRTTGPKSRRPSPRPFTPAFSAPPPKDTSFFGWLFGSN